MFDEIGERLFGSTDERAVSPVIGVILMVAVTVILAAVISVFVMDMGESLDGEVQAGMNLESGPGDTEYTVTWISGGNAGHIEMSVASGSGAASDSGECEISSTTGSTSGQLDSPGDSAIINCEPDTSSEYADTVTATAVDGDRSTVVLSESVED